MSGLSITRIGPLLTAVLLLVWSGVSTAAGVVSFLSGTATVTRGNGPTVLTANARVREGDMLRTEKGALMQLRMDDGAILWLKGGSTMAVDAYRSGGQGGAGGVSRAALRLLKGGLRTLTGLIGSVDRSEYELATPVATIGIRGTDYSVLLCADDCDQAANGLHVRVTTGSILMRNLSGDTLTLGAGQYGYLINSSTPPERGLEAPQEMILELPPPELDSSEGPRDPMLLPTDAELSLLVPEPATIKVLTASSFFDVDPPEQVQPDVDPVDPTRRAFAFTAPGAETSISQSRLGPIDDLGIEADGGLSRIQGEDSVYEIGSAGRFDGGFDPATGVRWGRWGGGTGAVNGQPLDLADRSLHWIYGPQSSDPIVLARTGSVTFSLTGNTNPTDTLGNVGVLGSATLSANFTQQTVDSSLVLGIGGNLWSASGSGSLNSDTALFGGTYNSVTIGADGLAGNGQFNGFFVPGGAEGLPLGAGLGYVLNGNGTSVSGTAAFGVPVPAPAGTGQ
ncbi:MAG: FecR family protein [Panacagrimonas sp.]